MEPPINGLSKIIEINHALSEVEKGGSEWRGRSVEVKQIEEALRAVIATREEDIPFLRKELETLKGHVQKLPDDARKSDCLKRISDLSNGISGRDNALEEPSPADSLELRNIVELPPEILEHIFSFIPENERAVLKEVCWSFRKSRPVAESKLTRRIILAAARGGHLKLLQWALLKVPDTAKDSVGKGLCAAAARGGHLKVLQWAHANGCPWDEFTCSSAAQDGHLDVLQWAHDNRCPWNEWTCAVAAAGGHLKVLQWAHDNGCPWDEWTCTWAARGGHLEVLQWALRNDAPYNILKLKHVATDKVKEWLKENYDKFGHARMK